MISEQFVHSISLKREKVDSFKAYPFCLPFVEGLDNLELHPKVTFFIGENGTGKSTLLESIALSLVRQAKLVASFRVKVLDGRNPRNGIS